MSFVLRNVSAQWVWEGFRAAGPNCGFYCLHFDLSGQVAFTVRSLFRSEKCSTETAYFLFHISWVSPQRLKVLHIAGLTTRFMELTHVAVHKTRFLEIPHIAVHKTRFLELPHIAVRKTQFLELLHIAVRKRRVLSVQNYFTVVEHLAHWYLEKYLLTSLQ